MAYFANGTEFDSWQAAWCSTCVWDHAWHKHEEDGCPILLLVLLDEGPVPQFIDQTKEKGFTLPPSITCTSYKRCDCDLPKNWLRP